MIILNYLLLLLLNLIVEVGVAYALGYRTTKKIFLIVIINLITHPLLCYFFWINAYLNLINITYISLIFIETLIVFIESFLLYFVLQQQYLDKLKLSFYINASSFLLGLLLRVLL
jgi:hypothetical protein